jgi:SAM-dependent methyltransferase
MGWHADASADDWRVGGGGQGWRGGVPSRVGAGARRDERVGGGRRRGGEDRHANGFYIRSCTMNQWIKDARQHLDDMRSAYAQSWSEGNAASFAEAGHYEWMAGAVDGYEIVLEIGTGTGQSTLELVRRGHSVVSIDENPACLRLAKNHLEQANMDVNYIRRERVQTVAKRYHIDYRFPKNIAPIAGSVLLVEGDILNDPKLTSWLDTVGLFDAVVCWLIGTHQAREANTGIEQYRIRSSGDYRLRVQNKIYEVAERILRPGGILSIVDRGEVPTPDLADDTLAAHQEQASVTTLQIESIEYRPYEEPQGPNAVEMELTLPLSGRRPEMLQLAFQSVVARKPAQ